MLLRDAPGQFDIAWTSSLRETLERIGRERFDAVLLDLSLPDSHGLETITRLCSAVPAMPILVITGLTDEQIAGEAVRCGAEDYLVKGQTDARSIVAGDPLCHRAQAGRGGVESGEGLGRVGEGRRRAGQPRQGPFPGGLEPRTAHAPDAGGDGPVDAPGPAGPRPDGPRDPGNGPPQRGIGGAADRRLAGRVADRAGEDRTAAAAPSSCVRSSSGRSRSASPTSRRGGCTSAWTWDRPRPIGSRPTRPGSSRSSGTS